jgi:hypothetical protein
MNKEEKKDIVSVQDFILNNPQALTETKDSLTEGLYDWNNAEEVDDILKSPWMGE